MQIRSTKIEMNASFVRVISADLKDCLCLLAMEHTSASQHCHSGVININMFVISWS